MMTRRLTHAAFIVSSLLLFGVSGVSARKTDANRPPQLVPISPIGPSVSLDARPGPGPALHATTAPETTWLGSWDFDTGNCDTEGWTSIDWTVQEGDFWHVDDFAGLGGGDFGRLHALEGSQSMWCGARASASDETLCQYSKLPGYGNSWEQYFQTIDCLDVTTGVSVDFITTWDSEPGYDGTYVQVDQCDDNWTSLPFGPGYYEDFLSGWGTETFHMAVDDSLHSGQLRVRFRFHSDGAWSDQDGLWNSDGGVILDSLTVRDAGGIVLPTELFETESVGDHATVSGNWGSAPNPGFGDYAALFRGIDVLQEDPCVKNLSCMWGFFSGSTANYGCGDHPEQTAIPYGNPTTGYLRNDVKSPWVPMAGSGSTIELQFDLYRDMPLDALVFYMWEVRGMVGGCPSQWKDRASVGGYGDQKDWVRMRLPVGDLIPPTSTHVQVAVGVVDMCQFWCSSVGSGTCHTQGPLFDNVAVVRIDSHGPVFDRVDYRLFQDNFSADGTTTGTVRADMALDRLSSSDPNIRPGDSTVVRVDDPEVGLAGDSYTSFGPAVYAYVSIWPQGQVGKAGDALTQDSFRWPVVDSFTHNSDTWYCLRMDTSFTNGLARIGKQLDTYCVDLNDDLFTPGDTVCFVFAATSAAPVGVTRYYSFDTGPTDDLAYALDNAMEFTCLPTGNADILYVDDFDGMGAQPFFDTAFDILGIADRVDRYDVRAPSSTANNGPGSRVVSVSQQLLPFYRAIIWNSGDVTTGTIEDGGLSSHGKSDDAGILLAFLDNLTSAGGLYVSGDNIAQEWPSLVGSAVTLKNTYIQHSLTNGDHIDAGLGVSPLVLGETGGCFDGDAFIAWGGCPKLNDFDVLSALGPATTEASYGTAGSGAGAVVGQKTTNPQAAEVGVILSGFSFHEIRDIDADGVPARATHLGKILAWLGVSVGAPTAATPAAYRNSLAQNYPNPFNPATTVEFTVREKVPVALRVYNVRGQLVKTLVDDTREPGIAHRIEWDGRNDAGQQVASGVYFYRLTTKDYTKTRKMVLLK